MNRVLIIGGGPAGLTAALRLARRQQAVTLIEHRRELGGRLTPPAPFGTAHSPGSIPVVLLGCHRATLAFLRTLGTLRHAAFRRRLHFEFIRPEGPPAILRRPWLPARLQAIVALAMFRGLSSRDRWRFLMLLERAWEGEALPADMELRTAEEWLATTGQSTMARAQFWNPLAHLLLGDDLSVVSASALMTALSRFLSSRAASRIALPEISIHRLLVEPATEQLRQAGATIRLETTAAQIRFDQKRVTGVQLSTGEVLTADWYVSALPPTAITPLLPERVLTHVSYFHQILKVTEAPALTVHLRFAHDGARSLRPGLFLLASRPFHWMVMRPAFEHPGQALASVVSTGRFDLPDLTDQALRDAALAEVALVSRPLAAAKLAGCELIREPRAFLSLRPGTEGLRPLQQGPFPNLLLAGDWTDTGWPATLESAILSGDRCADAIAAQSRS
jgi:squalene-associated FAD-dependent desaturase